jgi:LytS/YehU family sensor histidine kinase
VITVIGALIWLYFYYRNKRLEKEQQMKNEMLSVEMQSTRSQMNPHFVFNGINAIQNFIFNEEKKNVNLYISKFSELIRDSLKMSKMDYISLEQEVEFLEKYLKLEKNRFPDKFNYSININSDKPAKEVLIPPLFVQTLAENAVKHAFKKLEYKGMLKITYTYNSNERVLFIKVADNGVGLLNISPENTEEEDNKGNSKSNTHLGLSLLKRRINIINKKNTRGVRAKFLVNYLEKSNRSGTIISIIIPLDYE